MKKEADKKTTLKPGTMLNPVPAVMVSCVCEGEKPNIITLAWVGTINSEPPMLSISIRKERHSHRQISQSGDFVVNLVSKDLLMVTDFCGVKSGRDVDKFAETKLTPVKSSIVQAPSIGQCPINIECKVKQVVELGSHDMFIAEIVAVHVADDLLDETGKLDMEKAELICYNHGHYYEVGKALGYYGYSVRKKKNVKRSKEELKGKK